MLRNPDWTRDELILALDAYVRWEGMPPSKASPEIADLSRAMIGLRSALGSSGGATLRNVNGVYMKLMNFRRFDLAFTNTGRVGLSRGSHLEEAVWKEFSGEPERLARIAGAIRGAVSASAKSNNGKDRLEPGEEEAVEGRLLTVLHHRRERALHLVDKKKSAALRMHGKLLCEVCAFDFVARYGERGRGFIECHHTKPVETLGDGTPTRLQDLALVCSNCHRMIHARRPWLTIAELKNLLLVAGE